MDTRIEPTALMGGQYGDGSVRALGLAGRWPGSRSGG